MTTLWQLWWNECYAGCAGATEALASAMFIRFYSSHRATRSALCGVFGLQPDSDFVATIFGLLGRGVVGLYEGLG